MLTRENFEGPDVWHTRGTLPQDAQEFRPARPQRVQGRGVPSGYVEGLNEASPRLVDFLSILMGPVTRRD